MAQCTSSPTLTSSGVGTTQSVSTTVSSYVTTPPGSIFTTFIGTCATVSNSTICGTATRVVTQTATPFTTEVQVAVTVDVPYSYTTTLYGSSCVTTVPDDGGSRSFINSPVVSTITSSSVYTSDGLTYITLVTSLSSATAAQSTGASPSSSSNNSSGNLPAIIGGALGGLSALALLTVVLWKFLMKPRVSFDEDVYTTFNEATKQGQGSTPYHYTPVPQQGSQTVGNSFSNDTGVQPTGYGNNTAAYNGASDTLTQYTSATGNGGPIATVNESGMQPGLGNSVLYNHGPIHQIPNPSLTPLIAGGAAFNEGAGERTNTTSPSVIYTHTSDPTPQPINFSTNMGYVPQQYLSNPSGLAPYPQQHPYGPPSQGQGPLSHSLSVATSTSSGPSMDFVSSRTTQPDQAYSHPQSQPVLGQQSYEGTLSASQSVGSGLLQVRNSGPDTVAQDSPSIGPLVASSGPTPINGKGTFFNTQGQKAAIVHLDGGAYGGSSDPAPPAYRE